VCYGSTPGTDRVYDLYWIATHPAFQGGGVGTLLLDEVERRLRQREARMLMVETSSRVDYTATRRFYEGRGYSAMATVTDFYAPGDHRVIYAKRFPESEDSVVLIHSRQNAESSRNE
jgi:ribosomal protein S18 acetylase RimI-like enzyme